MLNLATNYLLALIASTFKTSKASGNLAGYWWMINAGFHRPRGPSERRERNRVARKHRTVIGVRRKDGTPLCPQVLQLPFESFLMIGPDI